MSKARASSVFQIELTLLQHNLKQIRAYILSTHTSLNIVQIIKGVPLPSPPTLSFS